MIGVESGFYHFRMTKTDKYEENVLIDTGSIGVMNSDILSLFAYGETRFVPGHRSTFLTHCYDIEYLQEGGMTYSTRNESWRLRPGDVILTRAGNTGTFTVSPKEPVKKMFIMIHNGRLSSLLFNAGALRDNDFLRLEHPERLLPLFAEVKKLCRMEAPGQLQQLSNALYAMLTELIFQTCRQADNEQADFARKLAALAGSSLSESYPLDYIAQHFGVGKRTLNRMFMVHFHCPPIQYFIRMRMEYAARLLLNSNTPVKNIARECGYDDPAFFSRKFKHHYGQSPGKFRETTEPNPPAEQAIQTK